MDPNKKLEESSMTVVVRFKQENNIEKESEWIIDQDAGSVQITMPGKGLKNFKFDGVTQQMTQREIYDNFAKPSIIKFLQGFNGTIFTYGQTSSGKTYTMLGPEAVTDAIVKNVNNIPSDVKQLFGIMPRSIFTIFDGLNQGIKNGSFFMLKCSYIEIYNENIYDLLSQDPHVNLKLREHKFQGWQIEGMSEKHINTPEDILNLLSFGTNNRSVTATKMNERSSRSHTVFIFSLEQKLFDGTSRNSKLNLVDLAGSERLDTAQTTGQAKVETQNINRSLYHLQLCIMKLSEKVKGENLKEKYVNFRDSKLTRILKDALGGNSKTTLICAASMNKIHENDTYNTLCFAQRAKTIKNKISNNVKRSVEELESLLQGSQRSLMKTQRLVKNLLDAVQSTDIFTQLQSISGVQEFLSGNSNNIVAETEINKGEEEEQNTLLFEDQQQKYEQLLIKFQDMEKQYKEIISKTVEEVEEINKVRQEELENLESEYKNNQLSQKEIENLNQIIIQLQQKNEQVYEELRREKEIREIRQLQEIQQLTERNNLCELLTKKVEEYKQRFTQKLDEIQKKDDENKELVEKLNEALQDNEQLQELYKKLDLENEESLSEYAQVKLEVEQLKNEIAHKDETIHLKIKQIIDLQTELDETKSSCEDLVIKKSKSLEEQVQNIQNKNKELIEIIQQIQTGELNTLQQGNKKNDANPINIQELYSPHRGSKLLRKSLKAIDEDWENAEQFKEEMNFKRIKTQNQYIQKIRSIEDDFQNQLQKEQQRKSKIREELEALKRENEILKEENSSLKSRLLSYEQKFKDNSMEISKLHKSQSNLQFQSSSKVFQKTLNRQFNNGFQNGFQSSNSLEAKANELNSMFSAAFRRIKAEREEIAKNRSELDLKHQTIKNSIEIQKRQLQTDIENIQNNEQLFQKLQNHMNTYKFANDELESLKIKQKKIGENTKRIVSHHRSISRSIFSGSKNIIHSIVNIPKQYEMFSEQKNRQTQSLCKDDYDQFKFKSTNKQQLLSNNDVNSNQLNNSSQQNDKDDDEDEYYQDSPMTPLNFESFDADMDNLQCDEDISKSGKEDILSNLKSINDSENQKDISSNKQEKSQSKIQNQNNQIIDPRTPKLNQNKVTISDDDKLSHQILYQSNESLEKKLICSLEASQILSDEESDNNNNEQIQSK